MINRPTRQPRVHVVAAERPERDAAPDARQLHVRVRFTVDGRLVTVPRHVRHRIACTLPKATTEAGRRVENVGDVGKENMHINYALIRGNL